MALFRILFLLILAYPFSGTALETLKPGILQVAVTDIPQEGENAPGWTLSFLQEFEKEYGVKVEFKVVPFDQSWLLAAENKVDVVATGVTVLDERQSKGATFSHPYLQVKRGLRIHCDKAAQFETIDDFVGYKVGAVKGMTAYDDLVARAPEGVEIVPFESWDSMYESFHTRQIQAVAEGYYVSVDTGVNQADAEYPMIDAHDLTPGKPEYLAFVVRDRSKGVLEAINSLLDKTGFPVRSNWKIVRAFLPSPLPTVFQ